MSPSRTSQFTLTVIDMAKFGYDEELEDEPNAADLRAIEQELEQETLMADLKNDYNDDDW